MGNMMRILCLCMCTCVCRVLVCMHLHCVCVCVCICMCMRMPVHVFVCMCMCVCVHVSVHMCKKSHAIPKYTTSPQLCKRKSAADISAASIRTNQCLVNSACKSEIVMTLFCHHTNRCQNIASSV